MSESLRGRFLSVLGVQIVLGFAVASVVASPDPYTQLIVGVAILTVAVPVAYWLVYRTELLTGSG